LCVLTSNNAREMSDALKRRCLHLYIDYPTEALELAILRARLPGTAERLAAEVVRVVQAVRKLDLKKRPSVSETLDWTRALVVLEADPLDEALARETLNLILKYEGDVDRAAEKLGEILGRAL